MLINEVEAKSVLTKSKLPGVEYVVNPYIGCQFGCLYCYASFMGRFVNEPIERWGHYLYARTNAPQVFEREYRKLRSRGSAPSMLLSSVTDPYQGAEKKYKLTRGILEILAEEPYPGEVSILTKSPLVLRDIDLFQRIPKIDIGMTVTSTDDKICRFLEVYAPDVRHRFDTLHTLNMQGIKTYAFIGPLLPHFRYEEEQLDALFRAVANAGVRSVFVEHMNLKPYIRKRMWPVIEKAGNDIREVYLGASEKRHRDALQEMIIPLLEKYQLSLRLNKVLNHVSDGNTPS